MDWLYEESSQCLATTLLQRYRAGAQREWPLLFQRTLKKSVLDGQHAPVRPRRWPWSAAGDDRDAGASAVSDDRGDESTALLLPASADLVVLLRAIERLPARRQEIFLLQAWEGMNTTEIATVLRCSEGSVHDHYSRALQTLRAAWRQRARSNR